MNKKYQKGAAMVEFAIVALWFFVILFGLIEFSRAWFVYNTLTEATRRGARIAVVCPASTSGINQVKSATIFNSPGDNLATGTGLLGLTKDNVSVSYLQSDAITLIATSLPLTDTSPAYTDIAFVQVRITGFQHTLFIPLLSNTFTTPSFSTTLPRESLGRTTPQGTVTSRDCKF
ncbi:MAG: TadE family protein [Methylobacter sp.]